MDYDFSFEDENVMDDDVLVNDETAVDQPNDDSKVVDMDPTTAETSHNEEASAGGVSTGNNQETISMDPVAATESYILRQFGLSREDMEEGTVETIDEAETIPNADTLGDEEDSDIVSTAVIENPIIAGEPGAVADEEVPSGGEVVDADETPDLGVDEMGTEGDDCCGVDAATEALLDWGEPSRSREGILSCPDYQDIVRQVDYRTLKRKIDQWMQDQDLKPFSSKEEFSDAFDKLGENDGLKKIQSCCSAFSFCTVDGQSYLMWKNIGGMSKRSVLLTLISGGTIPAFLGSLIKHLLKGEHVGYMYAVGVDKNGRLKMMNKAYFQVTKDKRQYRRDSVGSSISD
jgi:hypothetical protein